MANIIVEPEWIRVRVTVMSKTVRRIFVDGAHVRCICPEDVISHAYQLVNLDLNKVTVHEVTNIQVCFIVSNIRHRFCTIWPI